MWISRLHRQEYRHLTGMLPQDDEIPDVVEHPIGPELDLHTFQPREIGSLIPEYLTQCRARGLFRVRLIHGKGSGALRSGVHAVLARLPEVAQVIWPADEAGGSWGATWVILKR
jgi:DNA-nicking Smr family endonuclease